MNPQLAQKSKPNSMLDHKPLVWPHYYTEHDRNEAAEQIDLCVKWLREQGIEVRGVVVCSRNPRIFIEHSPLCEQLEGAVRRFERIGLTKLYYWVAIRFGCEVRWMDGGAE